MFILGISYSKIHKHCTKKPVLRIRSVEKRIRILGSVSWKDGGSRVFEDPENVFLDHTKAELFVTFSNMPTI